MEKEYAKLTVRMLKLPVRCLAGYRLDVPVEEYWTRRWRNIEIVRTWGRVGLWSIFSFWKVDRLNMPDNVQTYRSGSKT